MATNVIVSLVYLIVLQLDQRCCIFHFVLQWHGAILAERFRLLLSLFLEERRPRVDADSDRCASRLVAVGLAFDALLGQSALPVSAQSRLDLNEGACSLLVPTAPAGRRNHSRSPLQVIRPKVRSLLRLLRFVRRSPVVLRGDRECDALLIDARLPDVLRRPQGVRPTAPPSRSHQRLPQPFPLPSLLGWLLHT